MNITGYYKFAVYFNISFRDLEKETRYHSVSRKYITDSVFFIVCFRKRGFYVSRKKVLFINVFTCIKASQSSSLLHTHLFPKFCLGVPQSLVLGPLLHTSNLARVVSVCSIHMHGDDKQLYHSFEPEKWYAEIIEINNDLQKAVNCANYLYFLINSTKLHQNICK